MPQRLPAVAAVIPAAGAGTRLNAGIPKPLLELGGKRIIEWTMDAVTAVGPLSDIVVLSPEESLTEFEFLERQYSNVTVLKGGATRRESVKIGIGFLASRVQSEDIILIHDAARCMVSKDLLLRAIEAAKHHGAVTAAIPMIDSVKEVDNNSFHVVRSLRRDSIWAIQTPQVFKADLIIKAHSEPAIDGEPVTDDASLVERFHKVRVVKGERDNIKVTTPFDLDLARLLLSRQQGH